MWLCEKPWMKRISGPAGLPQSCAEMVRLSGVFTAIGLYFNSCPKLGPAATASNEAATIALSRQQVCSGIVIGNPPTRSRLYLQVNLQDQAVLTVTKFAWAVKHDRIGNYSPRGKPNRNRFGRSLPRRTSPWLTLRGGTSVAWLPITLLKRADELCIGQYVTLHCSLDLRF